MAQPTVPRPHPPRGVLPWLLVAGLLLLTVGYYSLSAPQPGSVAAGRFRTLKRLASFICIRTLRSPVLVGTVFWGALIAHFIESIAAFSYIRRRCRWDSGAGLRAAGWAAFVLLFGFPAFRELIRTIKESELYLAAKKW